MKKIMLIFLLLLVVGCTQQQPVNSAYAVPSNQNQQQIVGNGCVVQGVDISSDNKIIISQNPTF